MRILLKLKPVLLISLLTLLPVYVFAGGAGPGGGDAIAAQYAQVTNRALIAVEMICRGSPHLNRAMAKACSYTKALDAKLRSIRVLPRKLDTILGTDGKARQAGNDGFNTIFIDVDQWTKMQNQTEPNKVMEARTRQVLLALHEPLVLVGAERDDEYFVSNEFITMLSPIVSFSKLVGTQEVVPAAPVKTEYLSCSIVPNPDAYVAARVPACTYLIEGITRTRTLYENELACGYTRNEIHNDLEGMITAHICPIGSN